MLLVAEEKIGRNETEHGKATEKNRERERERERVGENGQGEAKFTGQFVERDHRGG